MSRGELGADEVGLVGRYRATDAADASVCLNLNKMGRDAIGIVANLLQLGGPFGFVFRVDIYRAHQPLLPELLLMFHNSFGLEKTHSRDLHVSLL
jgi:hypothetical protein